MGSTETPIQSSEYAVLGLRTWGLQLFLRTGLSNKP